jgi:phosphopantetheinyl transferase
MPLDYQKTTGQMQIGIWRMDESLEKLHAFLHLSGIDGSELSDFKSEYRKREWLTTRVLLKVLLPSEHPLIIYDSNGKPHLKNSVYSLSISHTKNFVAIILSKNSGVGIDLETIQPRIKHIAKKFVTKEENEFIEEDRKLDYQHVIWGTKEVLFKIYGKGGLNFLDHIHVDNFKLEDHGQLTARISKPGFSREYIVFYERFHNLMLVYANDAEVFAA